MALIRSRHPVRREALFEPRAHLFPVQSRRLVHRIGGLFHGLDDEAGYAIVDHFRHRTRAVGDDRRSARHRFNHDQAERFWPVDWKQQGGGFREKRLRIADLSDESNFLAIESLFLAQRFWPAPCVPKSILELTCS